VKAAAKPAEERKAPRPFVPSSTSTSRDRVAAFPAPPPVSTTAHAPAASLPAAKTCCYGTATAVPARPARLQRILQRVPGIRRIRQTPDTAEGYVAPRPAHEISMVLPPETRKMLVEGTMDLKASVNEAGRVTRVQLLSPKDEELVRLAAYAASTWPFVPAKVNDKAVASEVILHFSFNVN
jgi:TonB family protein